jgi:hypothetical protein
MTFLLLAAMLALTGSTDSPIVCNLGALTPPERDQHQDLSRRVKAAVIRTDELAKGYRFHVGRAVSFVELATWADFERRCCPFFEIALGSARESGAAWIQLTGRAGVKAFVRAELMQP